MSADTLLSSMIRTHGKLLNKQAFVPSQAAASAGGGGGAPMDPTAAMGGMPGGAPPGALPGAPPGMPPGAGMPVDPSGGAQGGAPVGDMGLPPEALANPPMTAPDGSVPGAPQDSGSSGGKGSGGSKIDQQVIIQVLQQQTQILSETRLLRELVLDMMKAMGHAISPDTLRTGAASADSIIAAPADAKAAKEIIEEPETTVVGILSKEFTPDQLVRMAALAQSGAMAA